MDLPTRTLEVCYHVGTLNPADRGSGYHESLEGSGLSISLHPDDWRMIARLGGAPTWELTKQNSCFINAHAVKATQRKSLMAWAQDAGLVTKATLWQLSYDSGEDGDYRAVQIYDVEADARSEYDGYVEDMPDTDPKLRKKAGFVATDLLRARMLHKVDPCLVADFVLCTYAFDTAGIDGVWWEDDYDPYGLSCPRGVIAPDLVESFTAKRLDD